MYIFKIYYFDVHKRERRFDVVANTKEEAIIEFTKTIGKVQIERIYRYKK